MRNILKLGIKSMVDTIMPGNLIMIPLVVIIDGDPYVGVFCVGTFGGVKDIGDTVSYTHLTLPTNREV